MFTILLRKCRKGLERKGELRGAWYLSKAKFGEPGPALPLFNKVGL